MRNVLWVLVGLVLCVGWVGCNSNDAGASVPQTQPTATSPPATDLTQHVDDVTFFTKTGITLALAKAQVPVKDLVDIREYVDAARLLIVTPNKPDFDGARKLAADQLPDGSRAIGLAIVDLVERYVPRVVKKVEGQQVSYQLLAAAALDGVVKGINQYQSTVAK